MDRIIRQVTDYFVLQLPNGKDYYLIKDLEVHDFPSFLTRRMHIELQWNLDESMVLPKTDWANTQSEAVQQAWQHFLHAIHAEVKLPASYAKAVIETAVADVIEMLVQPRKSIPDILFGGEKRLTASELKERTKLLVVYPHFARVLNSYIDRKNKDELTREHCKKIIERVDSKVTSKYTPLQWAQMLEPLFTLSRLKVDTDLLRLFFEDREMHRLARRFDLIDSSVTRAEFIEVLSSSDLSKYDGYEEDRPEFSGDRKSDDPLKENSEKSSIPPDEYEDEEDEHDALLHEKTSESNVTQNDGINLKEESTPNDELLKADAKDHPEDKRTFLPSDDTTEIEAEPDFEIKPERIEKAPPREQDMEEINEPASLNDIFSDDGPQKKEKQSQSVDEPIISESVIKTEEESSLWQRFIDEEDEAQDQHDEPEQEEKAYSGKPAIDLAEGSYSIEYIKNDLEDLMKDREAYFINELFEGSQKAYEKSLLKIAKEDEWEWASKLIANNIFKRYDINIYSAAAVDFTDRLQSYFLDKDNS